MKLLYQIHKWLAVVALLATMVWFVSGTAIVMPPSFTSVTTEIDLNRIAGTVPTPRFEDATVTVGAAIAAVRAYVNRPLNVDGVQLRRLPGHVAYEVITSRGTLLVDANTGTVFRVDEALARQIAEAAAATRGPLGPVTRLTQNSSDCPGRIPTFRVAVQDAEKTVLCISTSSAALEVSTRRSRGVRFLARWHNLGPLRAIMRQTDIQVLSLTFAVVGTLMSAAGVLILLVQLQRWWRGRQRRAARVVTNA